MLAFDVITIFPGFFDGPFEHGIIRRARERGLIRIGTQDLRAYTADRHRRVDDRPFGGGEGMGSEAGTDIRRGRGCTGSGGGRCRGRGAQCCGATLFPGGGASAFVRRPGGSGLRTIRGNRRTGRRAPGNGGDLGRKLRRVRRRDCGGSHRRRRDTLRPRRRRERGIHTQGFLLGPGRRDTVSGAPTLHETRPIPGVSGTRSADVRRSRGGRGMAASRFAREDVEKQAGPVERRFTGRRRRASKGKRIPRVTRLILRSRGPMVM